MTVSDFKRYMCQGHGRCYTHLRDSKNIAKYKKVVLWGCLNDMSYDIQVEGTRAAYVYSLTKFFSDKDYFLVPIIKKLDNLKKSKYVYNELAYLSDLLTLFALEGSREALDALVRKRAEYFEAIIAKRSFRGYDYLRDQYERICVSMLDIVDPLEIISELGHLFIENKHYNSDEFDWLCFRIGEYYGKSRLKSLLKKKAKGNTNIAAFYDSYLENDVPMPVHEKTRKKLSDVEVEDLADRFLAETDSNKKADILFSITFKRIIPPRIHNHVIECTRSDDFQLSENAFYALTYCQSDAVHDFALSILDGERKTEAIEMLLMNYRPEDDERLFDEIQNYKIDYKSDYDWHSVVSKINIATTNGVRLPKKYLMHVYNNTLCSYCRCNAVEALGKKRWLTDEIKDECRYDTNDDIIKYINRYHKKQI